MSYGCGMATWQYSGIRLDFGELVTAATLHRPCGFAAYCHIGLSFDICHD